MTDIFTILDDGEERRISASRNAGRVHLDPDQIREQLGWKLEDTGLCRGDVCIPVRDRAALANAAGIDLEELARALDRPLALETDELCAALGTGSISRKAALDSLAAPDFSLPDLAGELHTLSEHRGKKVLLIAYASW